MKKLVFSFERDWIKENRERLGNPMRQLEKFVKSQSMKLVKSDYNSVTVELEDDACKKGIDQIIGYIKQNFQIEAPWKSVEIGGEVGELKEFIEQRKQSGYVAKPASEEDKPVEKTTEGDEKPGESAKADEPADEAISNPEAETAKEDEVPDPEKEKKGEEEVQSRPKQKKNAEKKAPEEAPEKLAEASQQEADKKGELPKEPGQEEEKKNTDVRSDVLEHTATVVSYSPVMTSYLKELNRVIPMLNKMDAENCVWAQNLLVSIDSGLGYTSFLQEIAKQYGIYGLADEKEEKSWVKEIVISHKSSGENKYSDWESAVSCAKSFANHNTGLNKRVILSLDITEWQSELGTEGVHKFLRELAEYTSKIICVFRVPYMEVPILQRLTAIISDVMTVKLLTIPGVSLENMVDYTKTKLAKMNCTVEDGCETYLEQLILREKSDDCFYGYKTLEKLVGEIVYRKAIINCETGEASNRINEADFKYILQEEAEGDNPYEVLNKLIGIAHVKKQIDEIVLQIKAHKELVSVGTDVDRPCIHMMFTGNPGTGKTTVARLLARILKEEKVLRKGLFFEVQGRSLCGRYVGETAPRTSAICRDAYGSVLFIDEAYSLARMDSDRDYGKEAVQTLIAEMENHRDDFCVILAGYKKPMYDLMDINPGLQSRIPYEIEFPNYSREELAQIFFCLLEGKFEYEEELKSVVEQFFASIPNEVLKSDEFSNARMVRNLFERVWGKAACRCSLNGDEKITIKKEDFKFASEMAEFKGLIEDKDKKKIGF